MLVIKNQNHLHRVLAFAKRKGPQHVLWLDEALWRLHLWADVSADLIQRHAGRPGFYPVPEYTVWPPSGIPETWKPGAAGNVLTEVGADWAPASFFWNAINPHTLASRMNGGLIYHGDQRGWYEDDADHVDPMSVTLTLDRHDNPWSMHS